MENPRETLREEAFLHNVHGILSKLMPHNFPTLALQFLELQLDNPERLQGVVDILFEKAILKPKCCVICARLCHCLIPTNVRTFNKNGTAGRLTFHQVLCRKCQMELEKYKTEGIGNQEEIPEEEMKLKRDELVTEELERKARFLKNVSFFGELFKRQLVSVGIMDECVINLLKSNDEESYECLCKLLSTIGKDLDHPNAKSCMDQHFDKITRAIDEQNLSPKSHSLLEDVVNLRLNNWVQEKDTSNSKTTHSKRESKRSRKKRLKAEKKKPKENNDEDLEPVAEEGVDDVSSGLASAAPLPENGSDSHDRGYGASNNNIVALNSAFLSGTHKALGTLSEESSRGSRSGFDASNQYTVLPRRSEEEDQENTCRIPGWLSYAAFTHGFSRERNVPELPGKSDEKNPQTSSCGTGRFEQQVQMNVQKQSMIFNHQDMLQQQQQQQGQPQRMPQPFYPRGMPTRPLRIQHQHPQATNQPMYQSPPGVGVPQVIQMPAGGPQFTISPQQYAVPQVDYQTVQVGNQPMAYRSPAPQMSGPYNQVPYQNYSASASMPPPIYASQPPMMFVRDNPPMLNIPGPQRYQQRRPEQPPPPPRKKNIIQIIDPSQDNKDVTSEILSQVAGNATTSGSPGFASDSNVSGQSSTSNTPPINTNIVQETASMSKNGESLRAVFAAQVAAIFNDESESTKEKSKVTIPQVTAPIQTTSPKHPIGEVKTISIEKRFRTVGLPKKDEPRVDVGNETTKYLTTPHQVSKSASAKQTDMLAGPPIAALIEDEKKTRDIMEKFLGMLNKFTPQNYGTLIQQVLDLDIDTPEKLECVVNVIFEKTINEPDFAVMSANICKCLLPTNVKAKDGKDATLTFGKMLINKCRKEFERKKSDEININKKMEELLKQGLSYEELKSKKDELALEELESRRRTLGNIRFIGELFKHKMLRKSSMHDCIIKLLESNDEESYECLCKLLSTIGKDLDHPKAKPRMDKFFEQIKKNIDAKKTSSRCRSILQDVRELRQNNWRTRTNEEPEVISLGPGGHSYEAWAGGSSGGVWSTIATSRTSTLTEQGPRGKGVGGGGVVPSYMRQRGGPGPKEDKKEEEREEQVPSEEETWEDKDEKSEEGMWSPEPDADKSKNGPRLCYDRDFLLQFQFNPVCTEKPKGLPDIEVVLQTSLANRQQLKQPFANRVGGGGGVDFMMPSYMRQRGGPGRTNVDTESISLGPGGRGFGAWARGSSGGSWRASEPSKPTEQEPRGNRQGSCAGRQESLNQGPTGRRPPQSEREKALGAVRSVVQAKLPRQPKPVAPESKPPTEPTPFPKELTEDEVENKTIGLIDEYHSIKDVEEAIECVKEINAPDLHYKVVYCALNHSMEKHASERVLTAKLMHALLQNMIITEESYIKGLEDILGFAEDMEIDIPHIWKYLGELIGITITKNGLSLISLNKSVEKQVRDKSKAAKLMAEVLISARSGSDPKDIDLLWSQSGLRFSNFFSSQEEETQFLNSNNLQSLASTSCCSSEKPHSSKVQEELRNLILIRKSNNEDVFKWIDDNVQDPEEPKFVRDLVTVVCESCKRESDDSCDLIVFKQKRPLLEKYIESNNSLELQALFALQALSVHFDHPPGFLKTYFNAFYDEEVISENAFFAWEKDDNPNEIQGKATAKSLTVHFFEWLRSE